jgi:nitrite reductase/ring-hydroxylating ferredoxin subunit
MSQGLPPSFHAVCQTDEVPEDFGLKAVVGGRAIAVFRVGSSFHAIDDTCTHGQASLSQGYVEGEEVECPLHQGRFHIPTGRPACPPVTEPVRSYPVRVVDDRVYVEVPGE